MSATTLKRFADELSVAYRLTMQRFVALQVQGSERARETLAALHPHLLRGELSPATLRAVPALIERTDLRSDLRQIAQETVVIGGERDALVPRAASRWLAETLPRASYRSIAGAAHARFLSHPGAFLGLIADGH
jgi:pimeloyl-[acyl-carrier protein] methyl ester esterase